jgi:pyruvate/2-oxoglutarate/acetoin dehydrogenase E1 component
MKYFDELKRSMDWLNEKPDTLFLGQAVEYAGTAITNTLKDVNKDKLLEMPVNEDMQMGITNGLAMNGFIPVTLFPRWNFLMLATNQIVNHLDKIPIMTQYKVEPKVIIRTSVGSERPLHPQHQHVGDFTEGYRKLLSNIEIIRLEEPDEIYPAYQRALHREDSKCTILVEYGDYYNEK